MSEQSPVFDYPPAAGYDTIDDGGIVFDPAVHLQLEMPEEILSMQDFGYSSAYLIKAKLVSNVAVTSPFRMLSDEGIRAMNIILEKLSVFAQNHPRIPNVLRGCIHRSKFFRDFCMSPEINAHMSKIAGTELTSHPMSVQQGHVNLKPKLGASDKPVDRWHTDTTPFDTVLFMVDDTLYEGGKFEYMQCTRESAIALLKEGRVDETKIRRLPHQKVGYAIFQQGPFVMHRASTVTAGEARTTLVQSYASTNPSAFVGCHKLAECHFTTDPLYMAIPDWVRFRAWNADGYLAQVLDPEAVVMSPLQLFEADLHDVRDALTQLMRCPYTENRKEIVEMIDAALLPLKIMLPHFDESSDNGAALDGAIRILEVARDDTLGMQQENKLTYY